MSRKLSPYGFNFRGSLWVSGVDRIDCSEYICRRSREATADLGLPVRRLFQESRGAVRVIWAKEIEVKLMRVIRNLYIFLP